jgi:hypothetical protein
MFSTWIRLVTQWSLLGLEAQRVMALRMAALAAGGSRAQAELQRMYMEKLTASMRVGAMLTMGKPAASVVRHVRSRVRANERRLLARAASPASNPRKERRG